jgi:hypothetical protein
VQLHFRSLALTDVPFDRLLDNAVVVYTEYSVAHTGLMQPPAMRPSCAPEMSSGW